MTLKKGIDLLVFSVIKVILQVFMWELSKMCFFVHVILHFVLELQFIKVLRDLVKKRKMEFLLLICVVLICFNLCRF